MEKALRDAPVQQPSSESFHAWNPGLEQEIPDVYRSLETIYCPDHVDTQLTDIEELAARTGLPPEELVLFKPRRLALHELVVRVTADIVVKEGEEEEALGRHFREIAGQVLKQYIEPQMGSIESAYQDLRQQVSIRVRQELDQSFRRQDKPAPAKPKPFFLRWLQSGKSAQSSSTAPTRTSATAKSPVESTQEREYRLISTYKEKGLASQDELEIAIYKSLYRVLGTTASTNGYLGADLDLLSELVIRHVLNSYGSQMIGGLLIPHIQAAVREQGYSSHRNSKKPILISLKGASAAGKSSLRPMLKEMMDEHQIEEDSYATISPDIWRRFLLDYESLGPAYKYAGRLTSNEVNIIDSKLDHYIRDKAHRNCAIPHLLVDRFRFDSFSSEKVSRILHDTYAKYVNTMYMYFVVTPPEATVERGWERGLIRGRYKTVEDFLGHSVEAYVGMPKLLLKWLSSERPEFRYAFLDNSVPKGTCPTTIAYGNRRRMTLFDPIAFINIERYQKINIRARCPEEVYPAPEKMAVADNSGFLKQCVARIPLVRFMADSESPPYLVAEQGEFKLLDAVQMQQQLQTEEQRELFRQLLPEQLLKEVRETCSPAP